MNNKEINLIKFYLTNVYNYCSEKKINLIYKADGYQGYRVLINKNKSTENISNLDEFLNLFKYTTKSAVMEKCRFADDDTLMLEILKYTWKNSDKSQKMFLISIINMIGSYYSKLDIKLLSSFVNKSQIAIPNAQEDIQLLLTKAPPSLLIAHNGTLGTIFKIVFNNFEVEERDDILLKYITIREKSINTNAGLKEELKILLIKYYEADSEQLKKYGQLFSIVDAYLQAEESDDFFYKNNSNELTLIVDYEKVKAVLNYDDWNIDTYSAWINSLCQVIEAKEKRIKKIRRDDFKLTKTCYYKTIQVELKPNQVMTESEFKDILINFFKNISKEINDDYCDSPQRKFLITKWWNAYQLALDLEKRNKGRVEVVQKRQKL